ncbi:MAG TPA: M28 family peptidase [Anaerohalosphaeraceae bacterium]|nr:M28 family peptidase [Anaerohalosphaeraceae bacterium]
MFRQILTLSSICILFVTGCVSIPVKAPTRDIRQEELIEDVRFLSQPAFKGRRAGSWESPAVRRYLTQRFTQYGLVPWADCSDYEQHFRVGTNLVGVVPGSDPNLQKEIILVCAHYDHLGIQKGKVYPGAADNASGVAALLEIAESLSFSDTKPGRSICFAAFDAEEMGCLGSFAFTCRDDYDDSKIVAVVNMDMLGRDLLDTVRNSLLLVGTEKYPQFEQQIMDMGRQTELDVLPIDSSLVGPSSDHIAFVSTARPVLMFTCGIYHDYHEPADTANKIDVPLLKKQTTTIAQTVCLLANTESLDTQTLPGKDNQQLKSFLTILQQIQDNPEVFKLDPNDIHQLNKLIAHTQETLSRHPESLNSFFSHKDTMAGLLNLLKNYSPALAQYSQMYLNMIRYYTLHPQDYSDVYRQIIRHYLKKGVPIIGGDYAFRKDISIAEQDWAVSEVQDNQTVFSALEPHAAIHAQLSILGKKGISLGMIIDIYYCKGSLEQISDYIFLQALREGPSYVIDRSPVLAAEYPDSSKAGYVNEKAQQWLDILRAFHQHYPGGTTNPMLYQDLGPQGPQLNDWLLSSMNSTNPDIVKAAMAVAIQIAGQPAENQIRQILSNPSMEITIRESALHTLARKHKKDNLLCLTEVLTDETPCPVENAEILENDYPLKEHPLTAMFLPSFKEALDNHTPKTLGQIAAEQLHETTKKNYGTNKQAWQQWIEKHYEN